MTLSFFKFDFLTLPLSAFPCFVSFSLLSFLSVSFSLVYTVVVSLLSPLSHSVQWFCYNLNPLLPSRTLLSHLVLHINCLSSLSVLASHCNSLSCFFFICLSQFPHCIQTVLPLHWLIVFTLTQAISTSRDHRSYFNSGWSHSTASYICLFHFWVLSRENFMTHYLIALLSDLVRLVPNHLPFHYWFWHLSFFMHNVSPKEQQQLF